MSKHAAISYVKSGIRIMGYILLPYNIFLAGIVLLGSELLGILEELYEGK